MRILMIIPNSPYEIRGGAENFVRELSEDLARRGHKVHILSEKAKKTLPNVEKFDGITIHRYSFINIPKIRILTSFISMWLAGRRIRQYEKIDIAHAHFVYPSGLIGKLLHLPTIVTSHGSDIQKNEKIGYGDRLSKFRALIIRLTLKLIDAHIVVNKSMIKDAIKSGSKQFKLYVIYNGIKFNNISYYKIKKLKKYNISKNDYIILYLGRLHSKKCPRDLIIAFSKVIRKIPNTKLIFAGKGDEKENLKNLSSKLGLLDKVVFTGFVSENEKWCLLRRCDIFVLPSSVEGHPITIIEAMSCGKPIIATNIETFTEIIENGKNGILVPLHSYNKLADAIIELLLNKKKRRIIGENAKENASEIFDIKNTASKYLDIYNYILRRCQDKTI